METDSNTSQENKDLNGKIGFLLGNKNGSYLSLSGKPTSRYMGFFVRNRNSLYKTVEDVVPVGGREVLKIIKKFWCVERVCKDEQEEEFRETFFLVPGRNSFVYESSKEMHLHIFFDFRESYDNRQYGRNYSVDVEDDLVVVEFTKTTDKKEDSSDKKEEFKLFCAVVPIKGVSGKFKILHDWKNRDYVLDARRHNQTGDRWVYKAFAARTKGLVFAVSACKDDAITQAKESAGNISRIKIEAETSTKRYINVYSQIGDREVELAYKASRSSLDQMLVRDPDVGLYAGLWWFFQYWTRDECVSAKGMRLLGLNDEVKKILMLNLMSLEGAKLPNIRPKGTKRSVDALGWLFLRIDDMIEHARFNAEEIVMIITKLKKAIDDLLANDTKAGLPWCREKETWMDSIAREGVRIEICAQRIFLYRMAARLTRADHERDFYEGLADELVKKVRDVLWSGSYLYDGAENGAEGSESLQIDRKVRPNVFIAYYFAPELLTKEQWISCFEKVLDECWLEWGGIATVGTSDPGFVKDYSGENPISYHNGDSWFWLNNLAAMCLADVDAERFERYVDKVLQSSSKEILFKGLIGHHAELSSASHLKSEGCPAQSWSAAMFVELVHKLYRKTSSISDN